MYSVQYFQYEVHHTVDFCSAVFDPIQNPNVQLSNAPVDNISLIYQREFTVFCVWFLSSNVPGPRIYFLKRGQIDILKSDFLQILKLNVPQGQQCTVKCKKLKNSDFSKEEKLFITV